MMAMARGGLKARYVCGAPTGFIEAGKTSEVLCGTRRGTGKGSGVLGTARLFDEVGGIKRDQRARALVRMFARERDQSEEEN